MDKNTVVRIHRIKITPYAGKWLVVGQRLTSEQLDAHIVIWIASTYCDPTKPGPPMPLGHTTSSTRCSRSRQTSRTVPPVDELDQTTLSNVILLPSPGKLHERFASSSILTRSLHYVKTWRHSRKRKHIAYCIAVKAEPSHDFAYHLQKICLNVDVWFLRHASGQTDKQTDRQTNSQYNTWQYFDPYCEQSKMQGQMGRSRATLPFPKNVTLALGPSGLYWICRLRLSLPARVWRML